MLDQDRITACREALDRLIAPYGHLDSGVETYRAVRYPRNSTPTRTFRLANGETVAVTHDEREAPVVIGEHGTWDDTLLLSLTDETELGICTWLRSGPGCPIVGLGVDLANREDFDGERGERFNHLLFTEHEFGLIPDLCPHDHAMGCAFAFSAKEAAFKACAASLRAWYHEHDEKLIFDLRSFQLDDAWHEAGTALHGEAQRAMNLLGITRVKLARVELGEMALTFAIALKRLA